MSRAVPALPPLIEKSSRVGHAAPNLADYEREVAGFSWAAARAELAPNPLGGLNPKRSSLDGCVEYLAGALEHPEQS